jgi:hypothetical protein
MTAEVAFARATVASIRRALGEQLVPDAVEDVLALDCGLLRSVLWALSGGRRPVHVSRVLNRVADAFGDDLNISPDAVRARLWAALGDLEDVGDLVSLSGGYWLSAPAREVPLRTSVDERLLVGGYPTSSLPSPLRDLVQHNGPFRRTQGPSLGAALGLPVQSRESWIDLPRLDARSWARRVMDAPLEPYSEDGDCDRFELYLPEAATPGAAHRRRWGAVSGKHAGRRLARRLFSFGSQRSRIVDVSEDGHVVATGVPEVGGVGVRRLMYALDALAGNPVPVKVATSQEATELTFWSEVPRPEQRLLGACGELGAVADSYYPRVWRIPRRHADVVVGQIRSLGVTLT